MIERTLGGLHADLIGHLPAVGRDEAVLDIGCGTGAWLDRLSGEGYSNLHGIDLDTCDFATDRATASQANLDYDDIGLANRKFKLITAIEVIEHLENPGNLLRHVSAHLDDAGWFLITTPNIHSVMTRLRFLLTGELRQFDEKADPTHIYPVLLPAFERVLPRHSLRIARRWAYPVAGSITARFTTKVATNLARLFLPEPIKGDTLCLLLQKA